MENISPALAAQLQARRTMLNERFARAKRMFPDINQGAFTDFLTKIVDPLLVATESIDPGALPAFVDAAFSIGIELTGKKIIGPQARSFIVEKLWKTVFPALIRLILNDPGPILAKLSNAAYQLDIEAPARGEEWLSLLTAHASHCNDCPTLLALAQVCAWRCGMAHYRHGAIHLLSSIPRPLCGSLFQTDDECNFENEIKRLLADPWYAPARQADKPRQPITYCTGGFRGLGGPFIHPPLAAAHEGKLLLWCDEEWWIVHADLFGVTCKRLLANHPAKIPRWPEMETKKSRFGNSGLAINGGEVTVQGCTYDLSSEGMVSGAAFVSNTLLVSLENSHLVWIFEGKKS